MLMGFEEFDLDDDVREEYPCPFCSEYFDIVGLCCQIDDEHPVEAKNGVCPICAMRVGVDMVAHITFQHGNTFNISFLSITLSHNEYKFAQRSVDDQRRIDDSIANEEGQRSNGQASTRNNGQNNVRVIKRSKFYVGT